MKNFLSIFLFAILLGGCYNVRTYNNHQYTNLQYRDASNDSDQIAENESVVTTVCPIFKPQIITQTPDIPIEEIKSAMSKNDKEVIKTMTAHIRELRKYIADVKRQDALLYEQYIAQCRHTLKR